MLLFSKHFVGGVYIKKIIISDDITKSIIEDYENGLSVLQLTKKYPYKYDKLYSLIKDMNITIRGNDINSKKYYCNSNIFDNIDTQEKAYWLGFLYADGCVTHNGNSLMLSVALKETDSSHLEKFQKFLQTNNPIKIYGTNYYNNNKCCKIVIRDNHLCNTLIKNGVLMNKSNILKFPTCINDKLISHFIRGYFDGDGCLTYHLKCNEKKFIVKFCLTKEMGEEIHKYLPHKSNKTEPKLYKKRDTKTNTYSLEYGGNKQVYTIMNYLYNGATIYLDRKFEKYCLLKEVA